MAFNLSESEYPFMLRPPQYHHAEKANSTVSVASSTASNKRTVKIYLEARKESFRFTQGNKSTDLVAVNISSREFQEKYPWFNLFIMQKNMVMCEGKMKALTFLMTNIPDFMGDNQTPDVAQLLRDILIFLRMQKFIIVNYVDSKPDLVHYNGCLTEMLATYYRMNIMMMQDIDLTNSKNHKLSKQRAMSWMTHIAFHCDFSLDRICEAILKTKGIVKARPEILGELIIGLIELSIKHTHQQLQWKEMDTLTFVRVVLVFKRVIRWYRHYISEFMFDEVVRKRVEFAREHIVPPSNLKEILLVLSRHMFDIIPSSPLCPSDKAVMTLMLTSEYRTRTVYEQLEDLLCNKNRLALFALDCREGILEYPLHTAQSAHWRAASLSAWSLAGEPRLSDMEEERLAAFSLQPVHERAAADFPHPRLCLTPTLVDLSPPKPPVAPPGGGYNPLSVRSEDSDSSFKISSTTAMDLENPHAKQSLEEEFRPLEVQMLRLPLPNMLTAYITATKPNGAKQSMTPCFVIDDHRGGHGPRGWADKGEAVPSPLRHGAHQEMSEDTSADEDSGRGSMRFVQQSSKSAVAATAASVQTTGRTLARTAKKSSVPKRKGTGEPESLPDKRPRRCSASGGGDADTPLPPLSPPPPTPVKSVIQKVQGKVVSTAEKPAPPPHVLPDPLRLTRAGEVKAGPTQEGALGPGTNAYNTAHYFDDDDPLSVFDMGDRLMDTMSLYEVEGNSSNFQKVSTAHGAPSSHPLMSRDPAASVLDSTGGGSPMFRNSSPQMGGPLLNNTQIDVVDAPLSSKPPTAAPQSGGLGVKRIEAQQGFYQDEDCLDYLTISTEDYLTLGDSTFNQKKKSEESHSCNEMSDEGKSNTRSSKQADRTGRRGVAAAAAKKPAAPTFTSLRHYTQHVRATRPAHNYSSPRGTPSPLSALPSPSPVKKNKAGGAPSRSSISREDSVEPSPSKEPDKTAAADWVQSLGSQPQRVLAQLMSHVPPGPAHEKLSEVIKKARKSRQSEDARLNESRGSSASLPAASHSTNNIDEVASHSTNNLDESPLASHSTNCIDETPSAASHSTNSLGESPRSSLSVGPHPKKTGARAAPPPPPPPPPPLRTPSPPPAVVPEKRQRGRPRKKAPAASKRAAAAKSQQKEEAGGSTDEMAAEQSQGGGKKLRRRRRKGEADPVSVIQRSENRRSNHEILDAMSRKLNGDRDTISGSDMEDEEYGGQAQSHTIMILQQAVEKVTENLTKKP